MTPDEIINELLERNSWYLHRIREEVEAGRKQNALSYLSFALAHMEAAKIASEMRPSELKQQSDRFQVILDAASEKAGLK